MTDKIKVTNPFSGQSEMLKSMKNKSQSRDQKILARKAYDQQQAK